MRINQIHTDILRYTQIILATVLLWTFSSLSCISYAEDEEEKESYQPTQATRPILPPVVPSISSSPTPTPHISAPQISPVTINPPHHTPSIFSPSHIQDLPVIGNIIGEVVDIGSERDGTMWVEVKDELFDNVERIEVKDLENTPIVKEDSYIAVGDIKVGDTVNIIFSSSDEGNIASFIGVLTEEVESRE